MGDRVAESGRSALDDEPEADNQAAGGDGGRAAFSRSYPALGESVAAIRAAVTHFATEAGVEPPGLDAVRLAVSEAATNVIVHAYADTNRPGLIEVEATRKPGELCVSVADTGPGLQPGGDRPGLGLGLGIIEQLADRVELLQGGGHGLRVVMRFVVPAHPRLPGRS
jgi:serine/threonine-protein kinase RsbW